MSTQKSWFSITNKTDTDSEICIYEEIGMWGITAKDFLDQFKLAGNRHITLRINSPGGEVFEGLAIYNRLKEHKGGVTVKIDGIAASMASVIAMAGAPVTMAENALMMIHNPSGLVIGEAEDMRDMANILDKIRGSIVGSYEKKTGMPADKVAKMLDEETWLTATEAKELGFIDEITEPMQIAAKFDRLKLTAKLEARENRLEKAVDMKGNQPQSDAMPEPETPPQEPEAPAAEAPAEPAATEPATPPTEPAIDVTAITAKATKAGRDAERKRIMDIESWGESVAKLQNLDLVDAIKAHIEDPSKSLADFKEFVISNKFKAAPLAFTTDSNGATGRRLKMSEFEALSHVERNEFIRNGGKISQEK